MVYSAETDMGGVEMKALRYLIGLVITAALFLITYACVFAINTYVGWNVPSVLEWVRYVLDGAGAICVAVLIYHSANGKK